jgi:putative methyltransferase
MKNLYLFQPQQTYEFDNRESHWLPYSVGCLWSYAQQNDVIKSNINLAGIYCKRTPVSQVVDQLHNPNIAMFSCYIWNWEYNKTLAQKIKQRWPNCVVVFGGPQVTKRPVETSFFSKHPYVDVIVNGEGEEAFEQILLDVIAGRKSQRVVSFTRLKELTYPSPYTLGVFDQLISDNPDSAWQAVLETNRGCPYACTFCDWGSLTYSKVTKFDEQRVLDELEWFSRNRIEYVFIADANFGILYERDKRFAERINHLQSITGFPKVVGAQWAKNAKSRIIEIAKIFFKNHNRGFTVSVQSMNDAVLEAVKRKNMDISDLESMLKLCAEHDVSAYTEMILGLPHETRETWRENLSKLISAGQHSTVDVWFLGMLENSELNTVEQRQQHQIETVLVPKRLSATKKDLQDVVEYETIVRSTRYMSFDDLIDSYMFSHVVLMYHHGGWTQMLARFFNRYHGLPYLDFYTALEHYIKNSNGLMNQVYCDIKEFVTSVLSGENNAKFCDQEFHSALWNGLPVVAGQSDQLFAEIFSAFHQGFSCTPDTVWEDLKQFQIDSMYDPYVIYPYQRQYQTNIVDYIVCGSDLNTPCKIEVSYPFTWDSVTQYQEKSFVARRSNAHKTRYKKIV